MSELQCCATSVSEVETVDLADTFFVNLGELCCSKVTVVEVNTWEEPSENAIEDLPVCEETVEGVSFLPENDTVALCSAETCEVLVQSSEMHSSCENEVQA